MAADIRQGAEAVQLRLEDEVGMIDRFRNAESRIGVAERSDIDFQSRRLPRRLPR